MRILELHCDRASYKPREKAVSGADEIAEEEIGKEVVFENVLVVFTTVEKGDSKAVVKKTAEAIRQNFLEVKAKNILVYPYAHLSSNLAPPPEAKKILAELWMAVRTFNPTAHKSPFGWYKAFSLSCKGHPLSELAKTITAEEELRVPVPEAKEVAVAAEKKPEVEEVVSQSLIQEAQMKSRFYVMTPSGELVEADKFDYGNHSVLKALVEYETKKVRSYAEEPPHAKMMKEHHLVTYEPASDPGNMRWMPKGMVIKRLLEKAVTDVCVNYGALQVETPIMYDYEHPALKNYLNRFPARQYVVKSEDKEYFLRFSACFGGFLFARDLTISYKQLPLKTYEITHYSFRREQSGELAGLKRLRAFTMPDMHTFCADLEQAKKEFEKQYHLCLEWNTGLEIPFEIAFRAQKDFFDENKDWYARMVQKIGKPVMVEIFDRRYAYFVTKFEFNFIDNNLKAAGLSTVQIDVENAERFGITYTDEKGMRRHPLILHASIPGAIDRVLFAILEREAANIKQGKKPALPLWLAPTQVRIIPLSDIQKEYCGKILDELLKHRIRVDFDDRTETLQKKVRDAEKEWIPFIVVVGEKEIKSGKLSVRQRATGKQETMELQSLVETIEEKTAGKPFEKLSLSPYLSRRPAM